MNKKILSLTAGGLALAALICGASKPAFGQPLSIVNTPIVEFLNSLRDRGIAVIFSSELVPDSLLILSEPQSDEPLDQLVEILGEHDLALQRGPRRSWLIVRSADSSEDQQDSSSVQESPLFQVPILENIVVSASRYAFARDTAASTSYIDRLQLDSAPVLGDDALRTIHSLPGITSSGLTARTNIRGGVSNESLILLDGVRLYSPYHLKDFESLFGSISPRIVEQIEVHAGGHPVNFGDRMSAVVNMQSVIPAERRRHEVSISTLTSSVLSSGRFSEDRGEWLTSVRRGNLDLLIDAANSDAGTPQYTDFYTRLGYQFRNEGVIGFGLLALNDKITLHDGGKADASANYEDAYIWIGYEHDIGSQLRGEYLFSRAQTKAQRDGRMSDVEVVQGYLREARDYDVNTFRGEWTLTGNGNGLWNFGLEASFANADYDYDLSRVFTVPLQLPAYLGLGSPGQSVLALENRREAAYVNHRRQLGEAVVVEAGVRWDEQSQLNGQQTSPRLSILWDVGERATLRASLGRYYQSQGIDEVQVNDGVNEVFPAQRAEHAILSFEYDIGSATSVRVEIYDKRIRNPRPRFENLVTRVSLLPELLPDRVLLDPERARATGIELSVESDLDDWRWWFSFSRVSVEDYFDSRWMRRSWEEPWSSKGGFIWTGRRWTASTVVTVRAGWPVSPLTLEGSELVLRDYNEESFETFKSVDVRAARRIEVKRGSMEAYVEINNILNFSNPCCIDYALQRDPAGIVQGLSVDIDEWLPTIPVFGFLWEF